MVAVAVAAAAAADAVVVGDVECCGGGVDARVRCADRERRDEFEDDEDVEDDVEVAGDAVAPPPVRYLEETGLLEREFLLAAAELGLSSAGVSGGREGWAGSGGAVAAAAAATMPCRCRGRWGGRSGYARRPRGNAGPRGSRFAAPAPSPARASAPAGGGGGAFRIDAPARTGSSSKLVRGQCLQFEAEERQAGTSEVEILPGFFFIIFYFCSCFTRFCIFALVFGDLCLGSSQLSAASLCVVWVWPPVWCGREAVPGEVRLAGVNFYLLFFMRKKGLEF